MRTLQFSCVLLGMIVLVGCSTGPRTYKVKGTVTLDGQPLPEGDIIFMPDDKDQHPEPGRITNGRFELMAREGKKHVQISGSKIIPGSKVRGAGGEPVAQEYIPKRYNSATELTYEVKPQAENIAEFKLDSERK
jgi:hypothetical protein